MVSLQVNKSPCQMDPDDDDTTVDLLRQKLGLTGTKIVCGAGVCGACTVLVDGSPMVSCLLPVAALDGRQVTTVEGVDPHHPVAQAFAAHAALQCGFCTPGFVIEAVAFHDAWRAEHGTIEPTREQIAAALAGHLCRCGAYVEIYAAVAAACAGRHDEPSDLPGPRLEARDKISGKAKYTADIQLPGQLEGVIVRSSQPHARVTAVDLDGARGIPGVRAVVDLLGEDRTVRYIGQEIAVVAAVDRRTAEAGVAAVKINYDPLPAVVDQQTARQADAPLVYPDKRTRKPPNAAEGPLFPAPWNGNVRGPISSFSEAAGKAKRAIATAREQDDPLLVQGVFRTSAQLHTAFEAHGAVASWDGKNLLVHVSTQAIGHVATQIAKRFELAPTQVRVVAEHIGGAFGAKLALSPETVAAISAARVAQAPVRVVLTREEELSVTGYRAPAEIELAMLPNSGGELAALQMAAYANAGIAVGSSIAGLARLIYPAPAKELLDFDVVTNQAPGAPFRGPGGPVNSFALEGAVDEAARRLNTDPIALRQKWDPDPLRQRLYQWAAALPAWQSRGDLPRTGRMRRGIGVAAANWFYWWEPDCAVALTIVDGRLRASSGFQDMGTGSRSVLAGAVAHAFDLEPTEIDVRLGDSSLPRGPMSGGSRTTATIVPAALVAAARLRDQIVAAVGLPGAAATDTGVAYVGGTLTWREALTRAEGRTASSVRPDDDSALAGDARRAFAGGGLGGSAFALVLRWMAHLRTGRGSTGAVHVVEVEVDTLLGHTRVLRVHGGLAVGKLRAPELAAGQAHGAIIQNVGYALHEQRQEDPHTGRVLSAGLEDYRIPGIAETAQIELHFDEEGFEHVGGHGVGMGEISALPVAAAIANAVYDATGFRPDELPITPERLLAGLHRGGQA